MLHAGLHLMLSQCYISSYLPGDLAALPDSLDFALASILLRLLQLQLCSKRGIAGIVSALRRLQATYTLLKH